MALYFFQVVNVNRVICRTIILCASGSFYTFKTILAQKKRKKKKKEKRKK